MPRRIYLDNAATSWPKPPEVYAAVDHYLRDLGAPAGRSGYAEAAEVSQRVETARRNTARLLGVRDTKCVIFTANGTDSLNLALHGLLREGDRVVTTNVEHNSVLRPLVAIGESLGVTTEIVRCDAHGIVDPDEVRAALREKTRLVAISHASNVTGALQPVAAVARLAHEAGALVLCDAAQTAGHVPLDMGALGVDLLATSGHKGLLGPLGIGVLALTTAVAPALHSVRQGGTGTRSELARQPDELPGKYESGNLNVPGILGLGAAVEYLSRRRPETVAEHGTALAERLLAGLRDLGGVRIIGPITAQQRVPLVSIVVEGYDPQEMALGLDAAYRIQVRAGLHCAPLMHEAMQTQTTGGTVRFSIGPFNTEADIDAAIEAVTEMISAQASA
ncbi:MAG: cysteine desulfurase [Pirellulales bacterium]